MWVSLVAIFYAGALFGFLLGCAVTLWSPAFTRGFFRGFARPWEMLRGGRKSTQERR